MGKQFDDLAKALARGESRRQALRKFVAGTVGVILGVAMPASASADNECKPTGRRCNKDSQCCSGICISMNVGHDICA
jgi:hypothetical protein